MLFFHHFTEISLAKKEKKKKEVIYVAKMMGKNSEQCIAIDL